MILDRVEKHIEKAERFVSVAYWDSIGEVWTIGFGSTRIHGRPVKKGDSITREAALIQMRADLWIALRDARQYFPGFYSLSFVRQEALIEMAYNLGLGRLSGFVNMRAALDDRDYPNVKLEALDSKWAREDVPKERSNRIATALEVGKWIY